MNPDSTKRSSPESGYVLAVFLVLLALVSATVASFSLTSIYSLQESNATREREVSFQMARAGLDLWMGNLRADWIANHKGNICTGGGGNTTGSGGINPSSSPCGYLGCMPGGTVPTSPSSPSIKMEHHGHSWGWMSEIISGSGNSIDMGDTVYLPSESGPSSGPTSGDAGYFRIRFIEEATAEFPHMSDTLPVSCRKTGNLDPSSPKKINVNTASYNHLRQVSDGTRTLTHAEAKAIVDHRTGQTQNINAGDDFGLRDEQWDLTNADTFPSKDSVCNVIQNATGGTPNGCSGFQTGGIWNDLDIETENKRRFCVEIEGGSIDCQDGSCSNFDVSGRYRIFAKIQRPHPGTCIDSRFRVLTLEEL